MDRVAAQWVWRTDKGEGEREGRKEREGGKEKR